LMLFMSRTSKNNTSSKAVLAGHEVEEGGVGWGGWNKQSGTWTGDGAPFSR
jgi:hypothetical protein